MFKRTVLVLVVGGVVLAALPAPAPAQHGGAPSVLPIRERAALVFKTTAKRLDTLVPG
jgi:hypothetical protein